jgi:acyl-CoA thioesterase
MTQHEGVPPDLETIRQNVNDAGYFRLLDMYIETAQDGIGVVRTHVDARLMHPQQIVHGGVIFTLADTAMSMALMSLLPPGTRISTIEAKINFLLPVRSGELSAVGTIIHRGRSTAVLEAIVYNTEGEQRQAIARTLGTFNIASPKSSMTT